MQEETKEIEISQNLSIEVIRKDIKNIHLAVYPPSGRVRIAVPLNINDETIRLYVISKFGWIKKQQRKFESQDRLSPRQYLERESHYFLGSRYLLRVTEHNLPPKVVLNAKTYIDMFVRPNTSSAQKESIINEWYRVELKKLLMPLIEKWESVIGVNVDEWQVKQMKTKWGSCNIEKKRIWINLELSKKPIQCLEYIVVHEMIHLLERHHNERFISFLDRYLPQWKFYKEELNKLPVSHNEWKY